MGVATTGFKELIEDIRRMADMLDAEHGRVANAALRSAAVPIEKDMKATLDSAGVMPNNRTGQLKAAIHTGSVRRRKTSGSKITIGVHRKDWGDPDYYPAYVEYGHSGPAPAPPHPYIRKAYDAHKDESYRIIRDALAEALKIR